MKAIIPTGGMGTRMQPMSFYVNKHFIPVANKPLVFYPIEAVAEAGIKEVAITYSPGGLEISQNFLGDGSKWGLKFTYVLQENPRGGLANIFQVCEKFIDGDKFLLHLGDNIFLNGIKKYVEQFLEKKPDGMVLMVHHPENKRMGVPYFDDKGRLVRYVEKPEKPPHDYAIPGLYFFDPLIFKCFKGKDAIKPSERGEYEIASAYQWLIDHGHKVDVVEYEGKWLDPGKFDDWIDSNRYILDAKTETKLESKIDKTSKIGGRVFVGKNCSIVNSEIRGPVSVEEGVTITDSYIGPFTAIGKECLIQGSRVENCVLMEKVKILNVKGQIDNSLIGPESEISGNDGRRTCHEFFIGERARIKL